MSYLQALVRRLETPEQVAPLVRPSDVVATAPGDAVEPDRPVDAEPPGTATPHPPAHFEQPAQRERLEGQIVPSFVRAEPTPSLSEPVEPSPPSDGSVPRPVEPTIRPAVSPTPNDVGPAVEPAERVERIETRHHTTHEIRHERVVEARASQPAAAPLIEPVVRERTVVVPLPAAAPPGVAAIGDEIVRRATEASPEVHISIGRVVVRADARPPAVEPPKERAAPPLSLGDYLSARDRS